MIFVGIEDDGACANLAITDELEQKLSQMRDDGKILPFPSFDVQKRTLDSCEVLAVIVQPATAPPLRFEGRVFVRSGARQANPEDERRLVEKQRRIASRPFDLHPVYGATIDDLDLEFFKQVYLPNAIALDVLSQNQRSIEQQLASLGLTNADNLPTITGLLVCGKHQREFVPSVHVQFVRYAGAQLTSPIRANYEISGKISEI